MISDADYFGPRLQHPEATPEMHRHASTLLERVNALLVYAKAQGHYDGPIDPDTGTRVSGSKGNSGDGGFRVSTSKTGGPASKHHFAWAVDVFDPINKLDNWLTDAILAQFGLYREAPSATLGWCHLQCVAPGSGRRTYLP